MEPVLVALREGRPARTAEIDPQLRPRLNQLQLMTAKPVLYVCNVEEASAATGNALSAKVAEKAAAEGAAHVVISAAIEAQVSAPANAAAKPAFPARPRTPPTAPNRGIPHS